MTSDAKYARKLAREYGITDPEEIAAIEHILAPVNDYADELAEKSA